MTFSPPVRSIEEIYNDLCRKRDAYRFGQFPEQEEAFFAEKKNMEWLVLGAAQVCLRKAGLSYPKFAAAGEIVGPESPDFFTYSDIDGAGEQKVEITQVLKPGYKQKMEHKASAIRNRYPVKPVFFELDRPLLRPFEGVRESISKKARKQYASSSTLIIYYNVANSDRTYDPNLSFSDHMLSEHSTSVFEETDKFKRLMVLSADFQQLIELHPTARLIAGETKKSRVLLDNLKTTDSK